jgi:hypothetical protein
MRKRAITTMVALTSMLVLTAPAHADTGTYCSGWKAMSAGAYQNACSIHSTSSEIAGRGKGYYVGSVPLDQLSVSVALQASTDGSGWSNVASRTCGFTDIPTEPPGGVCTTGIRSAEWGMRYRTRAFLILFASNGSIVVTSPTFSPVIT